MSCSLPEAKEAFVNEAMDVFQGSASSVRLNKSNKTAVIRWGPTFMIKTSQQAFNMIQTKFNTVNKWALDKFKLPHQGWGTITGTDTEKVTVKFGLPRSLEKATVVKLAQEGDLESAAKVAKDPYYYGVPDSLPKTPGDPTFFQTDNEKQRIFKGIQKVVMKFFENEDITLAKMDEYKKIYENRTGKKLDAIALSNITDNIVAFANDKIDGTTLLEESLHFIVYHLWDTGAFKALRQNIDPATGTTWISNSEEYLNNYSKYKDLYQTKLGRPDWQQLVEQEIVTKVITNFIYNNYKNGQYRVYNKFQKAIFRVLDWFKRKFGKKNNDGTDQFKYTEEVKNELGELGERFMKGTLNTNRDKTATQPMIDYIDMQSEGVVNITKYANTALARLKAEKTRLIQLIRQTFEKNERMRMEQLVSKYTIRDLDDLRLQIDILLQAHETATFTLADKELLDDLLDLEDLITRDKSDKENAARIRELNNTIAIIQSQIEAKEYQRATKFFLEGTAVYDSENDVYNIQNSIIEDAINMIAMLDDASTNYSPESRTKAYPNFIKALNFLNNFHPAVKDLGVILTSKDRTDPLFTDLSKSEEEVFKQNVARAINTFANLEVKLAAFWHDIVKTEIADLANRNSAGQIKFDDLNPEDLANDPQMDISNVTAWLGSMVDMSPWQLSATIAKFAQVVNQVNNNVRVNALGIIKTTLDNRKDLANDPVIKELLKKYKLLRPEQLIMEHHLDKTTGYYLNSVNVGFWRDEQTKAANKILDDIERFMDEFYAYKYKFPRGDDQNSIKIRNKFLYEDTIRILKEEDVNQGKNPILERYKQLWGKWYEANTKVRPDIEQYKLEKIRELSTHDYEVWHEQNHYTYTDPTGLIIEYPAGELVIPNQKYVNPDFARLMAIPKFEEYYQKYQDLKIDSDDKLPIYMTSSYEFRFRMPQISVDAYDVFSNALRGVFKGLGANLNEVFARSFLIKKDDEIAIRKVSIAGLPNIYTPPVRFTEKLDNPQNLSKDVLGSLIMYNQMAENYHEMTKAIPMFESFRESIRRSDFRKPGDVNKLADIPAKNALAVVEKFFQTKVYGQGKQDVRIALPFSSYELSITKLLESLAKLKRDINLRANYGAMAAGYIDATAKNWTEIIIGRNITAESQKFAHGEFFSNYTQLLKDYESPIKTNKISIIGQRINLMEPNREMFHDTDKIKNINRFVRSTNYGTWRFLDYGIRNRTMLGVMDNYRFINGKWYTRERWLEDASHTQKTWEDNKENTFYKKIELEGNNVKANPDIKQAQWDFVTTRTKLLNRDIGGQKSDLDDAMFDHTLAGTWILMHKSFLRLGVFKRLKRRHRNFVTEKWEEGTFRWAMDLAKPNKTNKDIRLWQVLNLFNSNNELRPEQREGIIHTGVSIIWANIAFLLAVIFARAIDDDDDDPSLQFIQYLAVRNYQESTTFLGPYQVGQMVFRPVAGVDMLESWKNIIPYLVSDEDLQNSAYETKGQKAWIKGFGVGYRGVYETFPIRTPLSPNSAKSLKQKKNYMTGKLQNATPVVPESLFMDFESE